MRFIYLYTFLRPTYSFFMKRLLLFILLSFFGGVSFAQVAAIGGPTQLCVGAAYRYTDGTAGGTWTSSDTAIASIVDTNGIVHANSSGTVTVTYRVGPDTATLSIVINPIPGPIVGPDSVCVGSAVTLTDVGSGTWFSSNTMVATIGSLTGVVTGVAAGPAEIYFTFNSTGCSTREPFTVNGLPSAIQGSLELYTTGESTSALYDLVPGGTWSSSNAIYASVNASTGLVTALRTGMVDITYTLPTGCYVVADLSVNGLPDTLYPLNDSGGANKLFSWYPFCKSYNDLASAYNLIPGSINMIAGIAVGVPTPAADSATFATDRFGQDSSAVEFFGGKCEVHFNTYIPTTSLTGALTYSCWIYPTSAQNSVILYNGNLGNSPAFSNGFGFVMNSATNWTGGPYAPIAGQYVKALVGGVEEFGATLVPLNTWTFLTLIKGAGSNWSFYVNNSLAGIGVATLIAPSPASGSVFTVGNDSALTRGFIGEIDDIGVWNRQLSGTEMGAVYNFNPDVAKFSIGPPDTSICTDFITLAPKPQMPGYIYTWGTINPLTFISAVYDSSLPDTTYVMDPPVSTFYGTEYWLTISKPYGCYSSDTITVYKLPIPVNLGPDQNLCVGDTVKLIAHGDSTSSVQFLWSTGSPADSIFVTTSGTYSVTVDSEFYYYSHSGVDSTLDTAICVGRSSVNIHFHTIPLVDLGPPIGSCNGAPVTIRNLDSLYDTSYIYTWSDLTNFDTLLVSNSARIWLTVNDSSCMAADTVNVVVVFDTMRIIDPLSKDTAICKGATLRPLVAGNPALVGVTYQWTPTDGILVSNVDEPTILPDTSAWYVLRTSYLGCPDLLDSFFVDVQPNPSIYIGGNRPVCEFDTLHINSVVSPQWYPYYSYTWSPTVSLDNPNATSVVFTAGDTTILVLTVSTPFGCNSADSIELIVHPGRFDSQMVNLFVCPGDSVQLMPTLNSFGMSNGTIAHHTWSPGTYLSDSTANEPWVHAITNTTYTELGTSQYGCHDTFGVSVTVYPAAVIYLGDSVIQQAGVRYTIPTQSNCAFFSWTPYLAISDTNVANPTVNPYVNTTYIVKGTTPDGCIVYDSIPIHVTATTLVDVPNAFAPGNGPYNILKVAVSSNSVALNYFRIFNRWGVKVFETENINDGWDGTFNGKPQPLGVYIYEVEAVDAIGTTYDKAGNVTLLR